MNYNQPTGFPARKQKILLFHTTVSRTEGHSHSHWYQDVEFIGVYLHTKFRKEISLHMSESKQMSKLFWASFNFFFFLFFYC